MLAEHLREAEQHVLELTTLVEEAGERVATAEVQVCVNRSKAARAIMIHAWSSG